jgi:hypothetical protein
MAWPLTMNAVQLLEQIENKPGPERRALVRQLKIDNYRDNLFECARFLLDYKDLVYRTHDPMCKLLTSDTLRKLIVLPRGSFKSSIACEAYPVWLLLNNPNLRILLDSEVYTNSKNFLRQIRAHLQSEKVVNLFGSFGPTENWNEGEITISQRKIIKKEASITCSGIGAVKVGQHYDWIIFDDLNSPNNSNTPEGREKVIQHYRMSISLLEPGGTIVVIGTRYHQNDIIGWILEHEMEGRGLIRG